MKNIIIAALAAVSTLAGAHAAGAADATSAVVATINGFNDALNTNKPFDKYMAASQSVIDEFAPYHWSGPAGAKSWGAAFGGFLQKSGMSEPAMKLGAPTRVELEGTHAYAVVPGLFTFKQNGKAMHENGAFTYTLDRTAKGWKIAAFAWAGPRPMM